MKKTVFVGRVNDQEFDNVQDYNACVQAMMDMGKDFQATSSTQVVEVEDEEVSCDCDGTCTECKCGGCQDKKPLKPVTAMLPAYESRENGAYIDALISLEDKKYDEAMDNLDTNLNTVYDRVVECIPHNTPEQLEVYANAVRTMIDTLERDMEKTTSALEPVQLRINALEEELNDLYEKSDKLTKSADVINTYGEFYEAVAELINPTDEIEEVSTYDVTEEQVQEVAQRLTSGFASLLKEIFSNK